MEKTTIKDYNNGLETKDSLNKVKAVDASGNDILVDPKIIAQSGGCGLNSIAGALNGKWYRIAFSRRGNYASTALLSVVSEYTNESPCSQLFYIASDGYSDSQNVIELGFSKKCISKIRLLYKASTSGNGMLDIYIKSNGKNNMNLGYSNNIGFTFQTPIEVPDEPDAGYSVKEFSF